MVKRTFNRICCLLLVLLSFVLTLTACNTKMKFKVDFVVDGEVYDTIDTSGQEIIQIPDDPEKEGYIFYGWYWDKDTWEKPFTAKSLLDAPLSENMCVYAKWNIVDSTEPSDPSDPSESSDPSEPSDPSDPSEPSNDTQAEFATFEKTGEYELFISSGKTLYRIPLSQLETVGNAGTLQIVEEIKVAALGSFCNYSDGVIWVGDFINSTEVPVLPDSSFVCSSYKAWAVGYKVKDTESEFSSENWDPSTMEYATPDYALAITNKVQGLAFVNGKVALSTSYGRNNNAKIYVYNSPLQSEQDASITVNDKDVPVWVLDGTFLDKSYTLMPMSEGLSSYNGKLLVVFESGTKKYYNAKNPTDHIWSVTL